MRKILSILVALGLVLGMIAATAPVGAQFGPDEADWAGIWASVTNENCVGKLGTYNITFTSIASLTQGFHTVTVKFPAGTGYPDTWLQGHIVMNGVDVFPGEITRVDDEVTFLVPIDYAAGFRWIAFQKVVDPDTLKQTGIRNPATPGRYTVQVKTSREPMSTYVRSNWLGYPYNFYFGYAIVPLQSTYKYVVDFGLTYPEIAKDFVPPFKACGQESDFDETWHPITNPDPDTTPFDTWEAAEGWVTSFNMSLVAATVGCSGCEDMAAYITLTKAPTATAKAHLYLGTTLNKTFQLFHPTLDDTDFFEWWEDDLAASPVNVWWEMGLHFDTVGTYELTFDIIYVGEEECAEGCVDYQRVIEFEVYQWKDATFIELGPKWNLISMPIVAFNTTVTYTRASMFHRGFMKSIWHYDRCVDDWFVWGNGQETLTDIEHGKSYWVRMFTQKEHTDARAALWTQARIDAAWNRDLAFVPYTTGVYAGLTFAQLTALGVGFESSYGPPWRVWLWGTEKPMPPSGPASYPVCVGWNMVGYTGTTPGYFDDDYLWNFFDFFGVPQYGSIYSWDSSIQNWNTPEQPTTGSFDPGVGYWIPFAIAGTIQP